MKFQRHNGLWRVCDDERQFRFLSKCKRIIDQKKLFSREDTEKEFPEVYFVKNQFDSFLLDQGIQKIKRTGKIRVVEISDSALIIYPEIYLEADLRDLYHTALLHNPLGLEKTIDYSDKLLDSTQLNFLKEHFDSLSKSEVYFYILTSRDTKCIKYPYFLRPSSNNEEMNSCVINPFTGINSSIITTSFHNFWLSRSSSNATKILHEEGPLMHAFGISESKELALKKCLFESIERYHLTNFDPINLKYDFFGKRCDLPYGEIISKEKLSGDENKWVKFTDLDTDQGAFLASEHCYYQKGGPRLSDSNGVATHFDEETSILNSFYELIERELVGFWWYSMNSLKQPFYRIPLEEVSQITDLVFNLDRNVVCMSLDLYTDIHCYVFYSYSARGDNFTMGMGASGDPEVALKKAWGENLLNIFCAENSQFQIGQNFQTRVFVGKDSFLHIDNVKEGKLTRKKKSKFDFDSIKNWLKNEKTKLYYKTFTDKRFPCVTVRMIGPEMGHMYPHFEKIRFKRFMLENRVEVLNPIHIDF